MLQGLVSTKGGISVTDSASVVHIHLNNAGAITLPNGSISTAGVLATKGGISVTDYGALEKVNLSHAGAVTLPNASISMYSRTLRRKGGISVTDSGAVKKTNLSNPGAVTLLSTSISAAGLHARKEIYALQIPVETKKFHYPRLVLSYLKACSQRKEI